MGQARRLPGSAEIATSVLICSDSGLGILYTLPQLL